MDEGTISCEGETLTLPYSPTGNSIVERNKTEVQKRLRYYISHDSNQRIIQFSISRSYQMSSFRTRFDDKGAALPSLTDIPDNKALSHEYTSFITDSVEINRTMTDLISSLTHIITYFLGYA